MVVRLANERGKAPALTEFGEGGTEARDPQWFTRLAQAIEADPLARQVTYMLTWANFGGTKRAYVPYQGHVLLPDFVEYHQNPYTLFAADLRGCTPRAPPLSGTPRSCTSRPPRTDSA